MHGINLKPAPAVPVASSTAKPATGNSVWRDRFQASQRESLAAQLLQKAGIIGREQYCDALEIAESLNKSIDQVLSTSFLSGIQAELCTAAMSYLERGIINEALAADALSMANLKGISFGEGLKYFGYGW